jgi:nucleotide-binding universal stress UspA family protein
MTRIVVGVDESKGAERALEWALEEASLRNVPLRVIHVLPPSDAYFPYSAVAYEAWERHTEEGRVAAEAAVDTQIAEAGASAAGVPVERVVEVGLASDTLVRESEDAALVVVGSRGRGGFAGLLLGSVSQQVVQHAHCPVVVIPAHAG